MPIALRLIRLCLLLAFSAVFAASALATTPVPEQLPEGIIIACGDSFLKIEVCADDIIRVAHAKDRAFFNRSSLVVEKRPASMPQWHYAAEDGSVTVRTARLQVRVDLATGGVSFLDAHGRPILAEEPGTRRLEPAEVQGEKTCHVRQAWTSNIGEALYGLGQNQLGLLNLKGYDLDLWQHNSTTVVPFLVSTCGYGLLWDNLSFTRFGDLREPVPIPATQLFDADGRPGGLTASYFSDASLEKKVTHRTETRIDIDVPNTVAKPNRRVHPDLPEEGDCSVRWEGYVQPAETGDHIFEGYSNGDIKLWIDGRLVMNHWRQGWLPWLDVARVPLQAGHRHQLKLEWSRDQGMPTMRLRWKTPAASTATSLWSEVGDGIDYYFVYGPQLDRVVSGYRRLTGTAPMMPVWSFGLWQSRQRYETAQQSLDVVTGFRRRGIPFDNIVQDWLYWKEKAWGSHQFDPARFPDPDGWIRAIHEQHAHLMISVWGKFYPGTENFAAMHAHGFLYERNLDEKLIDWLGHPYTFYDAFNPAARKLFWAQVDQALFRRGVDAWWMDATEPDLTPVPTLEGQRSHMHPTALGPGARVLNASPLLNSAGVYEGQRAAAPNQRVFTLTRSGFAGQQRYSAAVWSGDISSTWTALQKQISAGLGFSLSGLPYWTMDIGGFAVPRRFARKDAKPEDVEEWRELNTRWFQYGTFVPLLRVHGEFPNREMWEFGGESHPAYQAQLKFDRLRYRLLPYIYSLAGVVTHENGTMMRPLVMDFTDDLKARDIVDQFMFGPALLVNPVTEYQARSRRVYLPDADGWFDFWTGAALKGGQTIEAPAPYDSIPLYVRAGSIVPFGPELQYTQEKPADPVTLHVYAGANGEFTLYEDDGLTYGYERGASARIPIRWDDARRTLTLGARTGSFPGMLAERTFEIVLVAKDKPVGFTFTPRADRTVHYRGDIVAVQIP
ncbi:TIM-barrel domain-containing protein [Opitutus sp. GAS368]|uniref:TIM-barrel domain-containing protein n=1 Tax=Opitutus sp. GAS368 TaxID=1882749 RepID=UPI00087DC6D9|nr:TIM-barrel domain-containing protein [Opitutus sp. GAS368]SDS18342.1 alpha-D-xyloside xylohydrolase [Opitutus sp. GAS368]